MQQVDGFFVDQSTGLSLPIGMRQVKLSPNPISPAQTANGYARQTPSGVEMSHDEEYGTPVWPSYASGYDDVLNRGIAAGAMANGGMTPVINTMIPTLVSKLQMMAATWIISLRGKKSPLTKALDIINRADDGDGSHAFVRSVIGTMLTDNRGVFISYAPIGRINLEQWPEYGFITEPIDGKEDSKYQILTITTAASRENRGLWTIDGLDCVPTGVPEYPYWLRKKNKAKEYWVLVPREFGTQIVQRVGSKWEKYAGMGTSNVWMCSQYAAKGLMFERGDWEAMSSRPPDGMVILTGGDSPTQLHDAIKSFRGEQEEKGNLVYKETMFATTVNENARVHVVSWTSPPPGYNPKEWDDQSAQAISGAFHVSPVHVRAALVGSGPAIETLMNALEGETSLAYARNILESILNLGTPPRVYVKLIPKSDSQLHRQAETWAVFALGLTRVQKQFGNEQDQVFSIAEVRALFEQEIGIKIPDTSDGTEHADTRDSSEDLAASMRVSLDGLKRLTADARSEYAAAGLLLISDDGRPFISLGQGSSMFLWCLPLVGTGKFLLPVSSLHYFPNPPAPKPTQALAYPDQPERLIAQRHIVTAFNPDGEPLPEPTEEDARVEDWDAAADEALALWQEVMADTAYANLFDEWEWDPETRSWIDPDSGNPLTPEQLAEIRQLLIDQGSTAEQEDTDSLINQLIALTIGLAAWEALMRQRILSLHIALYLFGNGNTELSDADKSRIEAEQFKQIAFLNGFARAMSAGDVGEAGVRNRAGMYYDAAAGSHERGRASAWNQEMVLPCYPGDCSSECCSRCGCYWSFALVGTVIEATWHRTKVESCPTCLSREGCDPITFNPETGEYTNTGCYANEDQDE